MFQLGSSLLDACVLASLKYEDAYGYAITQKVQQTLTVSESSLYPVLRRLQKEGFLSTYDQPYQGRNRRYYSITLSGLKRLKEYVEAWKQYKIKVDFILLEEPLEGGDSASEPLS